MTGRKSERSSAASRFMACHLHTVRSARPGRHIKRYSSPTTTSLLHRPAAESPTKTERGHPKRIPGKAGKNQKLSRASYIRIVEGAKQDGQKEKGGGSTSSDCSTQSRA